MRQVQGSNASAYHVENPDIIKKDVQSDVDLSTYVCIITIYMLMRNVFYLHFIALLGVSFV